MTAGRKPTPTALKLVMADKIEQWPTGKLLPYARNARTHSEER